MVQRVGDKSTWASGSWKCSISQAECWIYGCFILLLFFKLYICILCTPLNKKVTRSLLVLKSQVTSKIKLVNYKKSAFWESRSPCTSETTHTCVQTSQWASEASRSAGSGTCSPSQSNTLSYGPMARERSQQNVHRCRDVTAQKYHDMGQSGWLWRGDFLEGVCEEGRGRGGESVLGKGLGTHHLPLKQFGMLSMDATFPFWKSHGNFLFPPLKVCPPAGCGRHSKTS